MRSRFLTSLLLVILTAAFLLTAGTRAQETQNLPAGIRSIEVDGQPVDAVLVPTVDNPSPRISGVVELNTPTIELAVAAGNMIRFPADVDENGQFRATYPQSLSDGQYSLFLNDMLVGKFVVQGAPLPARDPGRLLDIARVVPYPADFGEAIPGLGFLDGRFFTLEEEAWRTASNESGDGEVNARALERRLAEAGWLQRYENRLAAPGPGDPRVFSVQVSSFVVEYASSEDATSAFAAVAGNETGSEFATIGDESVLTLERGTTPDTGTDYQAARLVFRVGPLLGIIVFADLTNQQPDLALLQAAAEAVAARAAFVADRQVVPLGSMAIRPRGSPALDDLDHRDLYDWRGGALTSVYDEDEATRASRTELLKGATDAFTAATIGRFVSKDRAPARDEPAPARVPTETPTANIGAGLPSTTPTEASPGPESTPGIASQVEGTAETVDASITSLLVAFPAEEEADLWFNGQRESLLARIAAGDPAYSEVASVPDIGDSIAIFGASQEAPGSAERYEGYRIIVREGNVVAVLEIISSPATPGGAAVALLEDQVACIEQEGCSGTFELTSIMFPTPGRSDEDAALGATPAATPSRSIQFATFLPNEAISGQ